LQYGGGPYSPYSRQYGHKTVNKRIGLYATGLYATVDIGARRLQTAESRYQDVLDKARNNSARRLLTSANLGMEEVAFLLGFVEVNSFDARLSCLERNYSGEMASEALPFATSDKGAALCTPSCPFTVS
jgi:hypothetical protein